MDETMMSVLVSVIMPVYNLDRFLAEAVESILTQTFSDFEFIIINDGSSDKTAKIIKSYSQKDARIKCISHHKSVGIAKSLNEGIDIARGKYIARMDADDISLPTRFEKQILFLDTHPEVAVVGTSLQMIDEKGNRSKIKKMETNPVVCAWRGILHNPVAHPTVMMKKSDVLAVGGYPIQYKHCEDFALWSMLLQRYQISNLKQVLYQYRIHSESISVKYKKQQHESALKQAVRNVNRYIKYTEEEVSLLKYPPPFSLLTWQLYLRRRHLFKDLLLAVNPSKGFDLG